MNKTHEQLERDADGYLTEYERLIRGLATLRDSSAFVITGEELALVASDPGEVIASAARQLAELRAENARLREAMVRFLDWVDDKPQKGEVHCRWCGQRFWVDADGAPIPGDDQHDHDCPFVIARDALGDTK